MLRRNKRSGYIRPKEVDARLKRLLDKVRALDVQYATGYPRKISESEYKERRNNIKKKFTKLRRDYTKWGKD